MKCNELASQTHVFIEFDNMTFKPKGVNIHKYLNSNTTETSSFANFCLNKFRSAFFAN